MFKIPSRFNSLYFFKKNNNGGYRRKTNHSWRPNLAALSLGQLELAAQFASNRLLVTTIF